MTQNHRTSNPHSYRFCAWMGFASSILLAGCAGNMPSNFGVPPATPEGVAHYTGKVYGGQQPVTGAVIQLYTVGTSGLKSASTALLTGTYTTDSNGDFSIPTTAYSCTDATQVYIVASGGDAGSGNNSKLNLVAALGLCSTLASSASVDINELTTVAAAYALAPFAANLTHIGASGSNPSGLVNAFANAANLVNTTTGTAGGAALPPGATVPSTELDTLANIIASCVNSNGAASQCTSLFTATGSAETFGAALGIADNPGAAAVTGLYTLSSPTAPFQPSMTAQPNDFTVAINYNANGGLATPYGIAIDGSGDAWVTNETGTTITELSPTGAVLATPTAAGLTGAQGIAIASGGSVWVANTAGNSVIQFAVAGGDVTANTVYSGDSIDGPTAIAFDNGTGVYIANFNGNSVTALNENTGDPLSFSPLTGNGINLPNAVAGDNAGNIYVTSGSGTVIEFNNSSGAYVQTLSDDALQGALYLAFNPDNENLFVTGFTTGTAVGGALGEFADGGVAASVSPVTPAGLTDPSGVADDGVSAWVVNNAVAGSLFQFAYGSAAPASPAAGFGSLNAPVGVAVDASGSVWTTNSGSNTVSAFIGLAAPVSTPLVSNE